MAMSADFIHVGWFPRVNIRFRCSSVFTAYSKSVHFLSFDTFHPTRTGCPFSPGSVGKALPCPLDTIGCSSQKVQA
jgi:hypothetical protein